MTPPCSPDSGELFEFANHAWYAHADVDGGETCHQSPEGRQYEESNLIFPEPVYAEDSRISIRDGLTPLTAFRSLSFL